MSRRVRELDRGGGGRLGRDGECCSAAEGRRDDMLAGEASVHLPPSTPNASTRCASAVQDCGSVIVCRHDALFSSGP